MFDDKLPELVLFSRGVGGIGFVLGAVIGSGIMAVAVFQVRLTSSKLNKINEKKDEQSRTTVT